MPADPGGRRQWRSSLRLRYAITATALAAVTFAAGGALALSLYRDSLVANVTQAVKAAGQQVAAVARSGSLPDPIPMPVSASVPRIQILDHSGRVVTGDPVSATGPAFSNLAQAKPGAVFQVSDPVDLPEHRAAVIVLPVSSPRGLLTVIAAASLDPADNKVHHALKLSGILAAISLAVVAAAAWFSTGRALRRVERIRTRVASIAASGDLVERVPDTRKDELGRLGSTLNHMLAAIADSSDRQHRFVADAAHELRTPLSGITTTLEVAARHPDTVDQQWLEELAGAHRRLTSLVNDLLELAGLDGGSTQPQRSVDLAGVVTDAIRRSSPAPVAITTDCVEPTHVEGAETHLDRIVTNLLDNALRYARTTVEIALHQEDGQAILTVADDGPGIPPEQRQRVWERFARLDQDRSRTGGGTGLGLALVKELAEAHHGSATVTLSARLGGAQFEVRLPAVPGQPGVFCRPRVRNSEQLTVF